MEQACSTTSMAEKQILHEIRACQSIQLSKPYKILHYGIHSQYNIHDTNIFIYIELCLYAFMQIYIYSYIYKYIFIDRITREKPARVSCYAIIS